ncbi:MAG: GNAT family N-acetyltransferase [Thermomicrobiales bacterium]|nr:GNAT family N-acetyltransferase [Thermomicrobiales bacterium]
MVELRTDRLLLREFREEDWPALHAVESLPEVARYQHFDPRTPEESRAYVLGASESVQETPRTTYDLAVALPGDDRVIGRCGLGITDEAQREAVLWYTLHPDAWGHGFTTEAARAVVDFAFRELRLHRVWAECDPRNVGSWRVLEKIGLRREGHLIENVWLKGEWCDSLLYAVLDREWLRE